MLTIFLNSALNGINKGLGFAQTWTKEGFKLFLGNKDVSFILYLLLMLLLAKQGYILKENSYKRYLVLIFSISGCKMTLALLEEVIILQVDLTVVHV